VGSTCEVAIVGAGPYGLSAAAHLRAAAVETKILGRTMEFWEAHMPIRMRLRSSRDACNVSDPKRHLRLEDYQQVSQVKLGAPVPRSGFIDYGRWFQREVAPDVDPRRVNLIESTRNE
jgi:FAD-dependent urate hydroxylase